LPRFLAAVRRAVSADRAGVHLGLEHGEKEEDAG